MSSGLTKMVILSIWDEAWSLGEGGGVADELEFIRRLTRKGIELHFLIPTPKKTNTNPSDPLLTYHTYPNIFRMFERLPGFMNRFIWFILFPFVVCRRLRRLVVEVRPDVVMGFSHLSFYPLNRIGREFGIPTVAKLFGVMFLDRFDLPKLEYFWKSWEQVLSLRCPVDHYIVLNDGTRGEMALTRLGIPPDKISFLPNGMDIEWADAPVDPTLAREKMRFPADRVIIVTFSRLIKSKRVELFLRAAARMDPALRAQVTFVIGGDGSERKRLERESKRLGLADATIFTGVVPHDEIVYLLRASDIFAATNELTNMSIPPCEAVLCGVPVVAFDVSGTSEVIREGETGLLVEDGDIPGFAKRLDLLVRDETLRKRLARSAAAFARSTFVSWERRIGMELEVLERLARSKDRPS